MRIVDFSDGFTSATEPVLNNLTATNLKEFASDAAYLTNKGTAVEAGDIYYNTALNKVRFHNGTDWVNVVAEDASGNLTVDGNLTVQGTTTTLNTQTLDIEDLNITVNKGGDDTTAQGAGITVDRTTTDGSLVYDSTKASKWKAGNAGSEVEIATVSDTQTFTSKTIVAASNTITTASSGNLSSTELNSALAELQTDIDTRATPADITTHSNLTTGVHGVTGAILGTTDTQAITNKDIDGGTASNTSRITLPKAVKTTLDALTRKEATLVYASDLDKVYYDDGTNLLPVGSGSGGATNFIANGDAETGTTGWATYADAAGTRPVDGTGGAANVTWTTSAISPLIGSNSFLFTKDAVNRQGQGASYEFTIDAAYKAKVLKIEMDYIVSSGTFVAGTSSADSDLIAYIYDVTNGVLIEPSSFKFLSNSTTISDKFSATFQSASNSTSYRLILHCATTSASAYVLKFDNINVNPSTYVFGSPLTDEIRYTPTIGGLGTGSATINYATHQRFGNLVRLVGRAGLSNVTGSSVITWSLPSGMSIDFSKVLSGTSQFQGSGSFVNGAGNSTNGGLIAHASNGTSGTISFAKLSSTANADLTAADIGAGTTGAIFFEIFLPILGWSSSVQMSDSADTRVVAARAKRSTAQSVNAGATATLVFPTTDFDTHGVYNSSTGVYTVGVSGIYEIDSLWTIDTGSYAAGDNIRTYVLKNGTEVAVLYRFQTGVSTANQYAVLAGKTSISVVAGDTLAIGLANNATSARANIADATYNYVDIKRISGPSAIAQVESINAKYTNAAGTSIPNNTPTIIDFATKSWDSHGSVTTGAAWKFTAPVSGKYDIQSHIILNTSTGWTATESTEFYVYKNGSLDSVLFYDNSRGTASNVNWSISGKATVSMNAGDYIDIRFVQNSGAAITLVSGSAYNQVAINRIGN